MMMIVFKILQVFVAIERVWSDDRSQRTIILPYYTNIPSISLTLPSWPGGFPFRHSYQLLSTFFPVALCRSQAAATLDDLDEKLTEMSTQRDETYDVHGVPPHFKEHYIISGYRSPKASFAQSLLYCFGLNNEVCSERLNQLWGTEKSFVVEE